MLKDLTRDDWIKFLGIPEDRIPQVLILRGTRNLKKHYRVQRELFDNVLDIGSPNSILDDLLIGDLNGFPAAYASVYGPSMASEVTHVFGVLGTPLVIQTGNFGALADEITTGDIFIVSEAYCGDGASRYYKSDGFVVHASPSARELLASRSWGDVHVGSIFTTSALFAEGEKDLDDWHARGFSAVDMETATTFAVAEHFGMDRVSLLFAFDSPRKKEHILLHDSEKTELRRTGNERMLEMVLDIVDWYSAR